LPFAIPLVGKGDQLFQPIDVDDLVSVIARVLDDLTIRRVVIDPVGPDRLTMRQILADLRRWLGFAPRPFVAVPTGAIRLAARVGDVVGGPINSTALRQLDFGNAGALDDFVSASGVHPRSWADALRARPSQTQDRWHARLYFVRPLLRWTLAALWIVSGVVGLLQPGSVTAPLAAGFGLAGAASIIALWASCLIDVALGLALMARWRPGLLAALQLAVIAAYTIGLTAVQPSLWVDPFGPLLKNLPILAAVLALAAIEPDR
jgi:hypothetical protein